MADKGSYYGSLGRQALASCYSTLDGVPFKISSSFRRPPKVISLPVLEGSGACEAFDEEYSYETETAVLAWARAREEAIKKAQQEEADRASKAQKEAALQKDESSSGSESDDFGQTEQNVSSSTRHLSKDMGQSLPQNNTNLQKPVIQPKPPIPKPAPRPGSILKPTPIQQVSKVNDGNKTGAAKPKDSTSSSNERFDITMFEQEADPFDNLELQTINDMEELKVLLDSSTNISSAAKEETGQSDVKPKMNIPPLESDSNVNASDGVYELAGPITSNAWVTFDDGKTSQMQGSPALSTDSNKGGNMTSSSDSNISDAGDYVKLSAGQFQPPNTSGSNVNGSTHLSSEPTINIPAQQINPFGSKLPPNFAESGNFKPVLPPIPKPRQSALNENANKPILQNVSEQGKPPVLTASSQAFSSQNAFKTDQAEPSGTKQSNGLKPARVAPPPPMPKPSAKPTQVDNTPKMWASVGPSLATHLDNGSEEVVKANPYSRHSGEWHGVSKSPDLSQGQLRIISPTPSNNLNQSSSSSQPWNHYRPLPPAPSPSPKSNDIKSMPPRPNSQAMGLTDPYNSLSKEAQTFTDGVASMGFLRAKVARAVEKFGPNEKEVLDHLIAVDTLVQKKFAPLYAEMALHNCQNNCEKAERFLTMQSQFEELGFTCEKIQDALIKSNVNHDQALDLLTAN